MKTNRHRLAPVGIVAIIAVFTAGCGGGGGSAGSSAGSSAASGSADSTKVTITIPSSAAEQTIPYLAQEAGLFKKYGLNVTVQNLPAAQTLSAISGGSIQFGVFAAPQPDIGAMAGAPIKWLSSWEETPNFRFLVGPGIHSFADLKGKKMGVTAPGSTTAILGDVVLRNHGVDPKDMTQVPVGSVAQKNAAFATGAVDAIVASPPGDATALAARQGASILSDYSDVKWRNAGLVGYMPFVTKHKTLTINLLKALNEAVAKYKSDPQMAQKVIAAQSPGTKPSDIAAAYKDSVDRVSDRPIPSLDVEDFILKTLSTEGLTPKGAAPKPADLMDTTYVKAALK